MTTIAFDGRYFASDTQMTMGARSDLQKTRKLFPDYKNKRLFMFCGVLSVYPQLVHWHVVEDADPEKYPKVQDNGFTFAVYYATSRLLLTYNADSAGFPLTDKAPFAMGSGADYAITAMLCGSNAAQALKIAGKLDVFSNSSIEVFDADPKKFKFVKEVRGLTNKQVFPWIK
jgi:ATP-dependent protease HslVU (ClpYQ) peptidase subunit